MNKFNKTIGNFNIKLTNTMITITYEGSLVKAFDTHPLHSFDKFNATALKLENIVSKQTATQLA
jgi:hypothetical protein